MGRFEPRVVQLGGSGGFARLVAQAEGDRADDPGAVGKLCVHRKRTGRSGYHAGPVGHVQHPLHRLVEDLERIFAQG